MRPDVRTLVAGGAALALLFGAAARPQPVQPSAAEPPPPKPPPAATAGASCEASTLAWLVGKPKSAIPVPVDPSLRRVYCSTCLVTQDYIPGRTDIVFDTETGVITAVKCG
jgi:hypothetical protein